MKLKLKEGITENDKFVFFRTVKGFSEKKIAYKIVCKALTYLKKRPVHNLPQAHIIQDVMDDMQDRAYKILCAATPDEACKLYIQFLNRAIEEIEYSVNSLILR